MDVCGSLECSSAVTFHVFNIVIAVRGRRRVHCLLRVVASLRFVDRIPVAVPLEVALEVAEIPFRGTPFALQIGQPLTTHIGKEVVVERPERSSAEVLLLRKIDVLRLALRPLHTKIGGRRFARWPQPTPFALCPYFGARLPPRGQAPRIWVPTVHPGPVAAQVVTTVFRSEIGVALASAARVSGAFMVCPGYTYGSHDERKPIVQHKGHSTLLN